LFHSLRMSLPVSQHSSQLLSAMCSFVAVPLPLTRSGIKVESITYIITFIFVHIVIECVAGDLHSCCC
jgi:hypothetical protein